jgi:hypothetical protein
MIKELTTVGLIHVGTARTLPLQHVAIFQE